MSETARQLIATLALLPLHRFVPAGQGWNGRPAKDRLAIARALVAKAVYNFATTRDLIERLKSDVVLRRICGWDGSAKLVPMSPVSPARSMSSRRWSSPNSCMKP